jgi:mono/diheme cytochrome c family protein
MSRLRFAFVYALVAVVSIGAAVGLLLVGLGLRGDDAVAPAGPAPAGPYAATPAQVARGAYLARAGNCEGCHTARGGPAYAGGRVIETPFGGVPAPNLTPDDETGLGRWSEADFWRALHDGLARDGRPYAPAFPYPNFTLVTREDAAAIHAYLRSLPPVRRANEKSRLRFPYGTTPALAVWRALYFRPGVFEPDPARDVAWNRGAYLVRGLGHCEACHTARNALGGATTASTFGGGALPTLHWYAPALAAPVDAGGAADDVTALAQLLKTGVSPRGAVIGPMADVVATSTQHLDDADLFAMATYLHAVPGAPASRGPAARTGPPVEDAPPAQMQAGAAIYHDHCAGCHGDAGQGEPGAYPALAGNRSVTLASPVNVVQAILGGGFPPSTAGNPRPYGMPPFVATLDETQVAAVATYVRQSFGNRAPAVSLLEVARTR